VLIRVRIDPRAEAEYNASGSARFSRTLRIEAPPQRVLEKAAEFFAATPGLMQLAGAGELHGEGRDGSARLTATVAIAPGVGATFLEVNIGRLPHPWMSSLIRYVGGPTGLVVPVIVGFMLNVSPLVATLGGVAGCSAVVAGYPAVARGIASRWADRMRALILRLESELQSMPKGDAYRAAAG